MTRRSLPSDPLHLLRESSDVAPTEGAEGRVLLRLAQLAGPSSLASSVGALGPTGRPSLGALGRRFLRWSLTPLGIGIAIGSGGQALLARRQPNPQSSAAAVQAAPVMSVPTAAVPSQPLSPPAVELPMPVAQPSVAPARSTLVDERTLLDRARRQLASDEPARALVFLEQHAQRYGHGELTEEREAMRINVLVQLDRKDEAKARGEAFAARFPNSIMGASVRAALKAAEAKK